MMIAASLLTALEAGLAEMHLQISSDKQEKLVAYLQLIHKWNMVHNLTAVRDPLEMVTLHVLDSLSVLPHVQKLDTREARYLLDVGAGAGLPSIPLAICLPELQITAIDSVQKKTSFMRQVKGELGLSNFHVETGRVEALKKDHLFDIIISRAFSEITLFIKLTRHLLANDGQWLAMKGVMPDQELADLKKLQLDIHVAKTLPLNVAGLHAERHLVFLHPPVFTK
jgi:16S rRNA (guanine527-N7)-methyltransferase